jgi:hypothetical protein
MYREAVGNEHVRVLIRNNMTEVRVSPTPTEGPDQSLERQNISDNFFCEKRPAI